ncbi:DNA-formamidopyrimidine glycosylase family protein [Tahibacter harae]|uniref:Endonuclease n=1 Tax=Tahibacter harae TaxID=2963937 RepID=A0ABT1QTB2_9GAMM|nr:DNA-formamidopyrimidine glycosylase family protein [Tahibacter harae]MCQ4165530.1 endonuclease [Tahibacter harae]
MPEGPSIVILREEAAHLAGMRITHVSGNARIDLGRLQGRTIVALRSWGKHFLIELDGFSVRVHFLLFGSYRIDERRDNMKPRLSLRGAAGELNLYACSVRLIEEPLDQVYDWRVDILSERWDAALARRKLAAQPALLACDAVLDQDIFAGAGNIIKNEVLFRIRLHPLSQLGAMPARRRAELVRAVRDYAFDFLAWKKAYVLRKHWQVHAQRRCPRCQIPLSLAVLGRTRRRSFFCAQCQVLYADSSHDAPPDAAQPRSAAVRRNRSAPRQSS